ncbi:MAG: sigma-70 family RNA polymerase sigma factor, partial [Planctomycetes bacterium]|nr:sigma-70 family RNA polymerase sigma factor [Planctomycetota bacterium]
MTPEELLAHAGFVRSLAHRLVLDDHTAADVEQKTWLAAIEHPPGSKKNLQSWFGRVVRNLVVSFHRSETRRKKYEQSPDSQDPICSPEEIALRKEALHRMSQAVFSLEEPYISTIMLRFYEDLPPREVAARLGVPVETVKTRIQRALKLLRDELDTQYQGDRKQWCMALAPVAGLVWPTAKAAAAAGLLKTASTVLKTAELPVAINSISPAAFVIPAKIQACLLAVLLLGTTITAHRLFLELPEPPPADQTSGLLGDEPGGTGSGAFDSDPAAVAALSYRGDMEDNRGREAASPFFISGHVEDLNTKEPVPTFDLRIFECIGPKDWNPLHHETVKDVAGRFYFPLEKAGNYILMIRASRYQMAILGDILVPPKDDSTNDLTIALDPGFSIKGRVVTDRTGAPVANALVGPAGHHPISTTDLIGLDLLHFEESSLHTYSDAQGFFTLQGLCERDRTIAAVHPGFAEQAMNVQPESGEKVEIRLKEGYRIYGIALDDQGHPAPGVLIRLFGRDLPICLPVLTEPDGTFRTPPICPGRIYLEANDPPQELSALSGFTEEHRVVDIVDQDVEVDFGPKDSYLSWRGRVFGYDGIALPKSQLVLSPARYSYWESKHYRLFHDVYCDEAGLFEMGKLLPGRYRVEIILPASQDRVYWGRLTLEGSGLMEKDLYLNRNGLLAGTVVDAITGQPREGQSGEIWAWQPDLKQVGYSAHLEKDGSFEIRNVIPGNYAMQAMMDDRYTDTLYGVKMEEGEQVSGLELTIPPGGKLHLVFDGFEDQADECRFSLAIAPEHDLGAAHFFGTERLKTPRGSERNYAMETGPWIVSMTFNDLGYLEKTFEVFENQTTTLTVHRSELILSETPIEVCGRLNEQNGQGLAAVPVHFQANSVPGLEDGSVLSAVTGQGGDYVISGLKPGRWTVEAESPLGALVRFAPCWIPTKAQSPLHLDLMMPDGHISGSLDIREEGFSFMGAQQPTWWKASLLDLKTNRPVSLYEGSEGGRRFQLAGVPGGEYQLSISAEGYFDFKSTSF